MNKLIFFFMTVAFVMAQNPPEVPAPSVAELQASYWKAAAQATAVQAALRNSMSDAQKQMEAQRDQIGAQAEAARKKLEAICSAQKQALDAASMQCTTPPAAPVVKK